MNKALVALIRQILPDLPGFIVKKRLLYLKPIRPILRAVYFDASGYSKDWFYINEFVQPLYVPNSHFAFNFGNRIRDSQRKDGWDLAKPEIVEEVTSALQERALPFLESIVTVDDFIASYREHSQINPHTPKNIGYSLVRVGRFGEAQEVFDRLLPQLDLGSSWQLDMDCDIRRLKTLIDNDPAGAIRQLQDWEVDTARKLGFSEADWGLIENSK